MSSVPPPPPPPPAMPPTPPTPPMGGGAPVPPGGSGIQNYLVLAIIGTVLGLFCCCVGSIPGIIGIVFSNQASKLAASGDMAGALSKANTAKILGIVGIALGAIGIVLIILNILSGGWSWNYSTSN